MSSLDFPIIPFNRREKRDISLSRLTSGTVNLEGNFSFRVLVSPTFKRNKREKSIYAKRLLDEILPNRSHKSCFRSNNSKKKKKDTPATKHNSLINQHKTKDTHSSTQLEKIIEINNNKREVKLYRKSCDLKRHHPHNKFITNFLFPLNHFISKDFKINIEDYEVLSKIIIQKGWNIPPIPPYHIKQLYQKQSNTT